MKNIERIAAFTLAFSAFSAFVDDCESRLNTGDTCKKEVPSRRDDQLSPGPATPTVPSKGKSMAVHVAGINGRPGRWHFPISACFTADNVLEHPERFFDGFQAAWR